MSKLKRYGKVFLIAYTVQAVAGMLMGIYVGVMYPDMVLGMIR